MKKHQKEDLVSRRDFLRQSACAALGVTGLVNALAHLRLISAAMAQASPGEYRALVCLFLNGGNDSNNLLIPSGDPASDERRADYERGRGILAIPRALLHGINADNEPGSFGVHPNAQALATLFNSGALAFVCNVGTLAYPIATRQQYINGTVPVPPQLFSHSDQRLQWQSTVADKPFTSGWGGAIADLLHASYNASSNVSMSISLAGINSFQIGTNSQLVQYAVNPGGTVSLSGYGTNYSSALNPDGSYRTGDSGRRLKAFEDIMRLTHENLLEDAYNKVVASARDKEAVIGAALTAASATGINFDTIFAGAATPLGDQLKMIAKLIAGRGSLGNNRQIFFCQVGGYDTHQTMLASHANLMTELSNGMKAFYDATAAMGLANNVTTFTASDFNRTLTPNGTDTNAGSDHAWGGHAMVMGGSVIGKNIYGRFPSLKTGADLDSHSSRGRWIPTASVDQFAAVLARWMGVSGSALNAIFPNLPRFDDPFGSSTANMAFMRP